MTSSPLRAHALPAAVALAVAALAILATWTLKIAPAAAAFLLELEALAVALAAPALAARALEDEERGREVRFPARAGVAATTFATVALAVVGASVAHGAPGIGAALLAQALLALLGVAIFAASLAVGQRAGSGAALAAGLALGVLLLGFPYLGGDLVAALPRAWEQEVVHWMVAVCPAIALAGSFAGTDPFHEGLLYERFRPIGQGEVGYQYATPLRALAVHAAIATLFVCAALLARRSRTAPPVDDASDQDAALPAGRGWLGKGLVGLVFALFLLAPSPASAQVLGGGEGGAPLQEGEIGPMGTRVRLGYLLPFLDGHFKIGPYGTAVVSRFDLKKDLHLEPEYTIPTFEVEVGWQGAGRAWVEYWEAQFKGDVFSFPQNQAIFRNIKIPAGNTANVKYQFRTIALHGSIDIPVLDWVTLKLTATTRYVHFHTEMRDRRSYQRDENNFDVYVPGIGPGFDMFVFDKVYLYGSLEWLDFTYDGSHPIHYREALAGVRFELLESAHVGGEFYALEVGVQDSKHQYYQRVLGIRIWVGVQF